MNIPSHYQIPGKCQRHIHSHLTNEPELCSDYYKVDPKNFYKWYFPWETTLAKLQSYITEHNKQLF